MPGVMRHDIKRLAVGALLSVLSISLITMAIFGLGSDYKDWALFSAYASGIVSSLVAIAFVLFWGLPIHFALTKYKKTGFWWYLIAGFLAGPIFLFATSLSGNDTLNYLIIQSALCGALGAIGAIVFWFYVVKSAS